jgi:hypothetical protein
MNNPPLAASVENRRLRREKKIQILSAIEDIEVRRTVRIQRGPLSPCLTPCPVLMKIFLLPVCSCLRAGTLDISPIRSGFSDIITRYDILIVGQPVTNASPGHG